MAIGFTSAGRKGKAIGECRDNRLSADGHFEIFIRPDLAPAPDAMPAQIAATGRCSMTRWTTTSTITGMKAKRLIGRLAL